MLLTGPEIVRARHQGEILISPFDERNVGSSQYDVTLGPYFWRPWRRPGLFNPFDPACRDMFVLHKAIRMEEYEQWGEDLRLVGVSSDDLVYMLGPGEVVLGHTRELIGSACDTITTEMKSRSSTGRSFLEFCRCAGMGDHGYHNRWTLEIQNNSRDFTIPLVVGRRYAQILFHRTEPVGQERMYRGKYQAAQMTPEEMEASWSPEQMLPQMWRDRECSS